MKGEFTMKNLMKTFKSFIKDDNGAELLEYAIVIIIVAALAAVIYGIASSAKSKVDEAKGAIDGIPVDIGGGDGKSKP